jgi:sugar-specific transcriptional regulator TrmB
MDILKDLFDEKVIEIVNLFLDNPEKRFCLTDISSLSKVNIATTFRILNKLISKGFVRTIVIGKVRIYQLEKNEKTLALTKLLRKDSNPLQSFVDEISKHPRVKKIILESKDKKSAKIFIVGEFLPIDKINKTCDKIKQEENFSISFVEISENQFKGLKNFGTYHLDKKIVWQKEEES